MTRPDPKLTVQTVRVLGAFLDAGGGEMSGADVGRSTKLLSGSLYPILMRLEEVGWLSSRWEDGEPGALGRPRRRFYRLTGLGQTRARAAINGLVPMTGRLVWV